MLFTQLLFPVFFVVVFLGHWALRGQRARKLWLLAASYAFYAAWDWRFVALLFGGTAADYLAGAMLGRERPPGGRRAWLLASIAVNLGILGAFKYAQFFVDSASDLLLALGVYVPHIALEIVLPVGISFFTFQSLSYTIDIYRGRIRPASSFIDFAVFIAFFPHLVAGPVVRASELLPQLATPRWLSDVRIRASLGLFLAGFIKKACIADRIGLVVDPIFASPAHYDPASLWLGAALYHVQIYCDFSGYTDMAIAVAGLLGYRLPQNFDFPYLAGSLRDFWRRWHMTLTRWFRDYLYIPLGGNRRSPWVTGRNLIVVFLLCGLWHGAAWGFVLWGATHGALLIVERGALGRALARLPHPARMAYVNLAATVAWVLFRAPDGLHARSYLAGMFGLGPELPASVARAAPLEWALLLPILLGVHVVAWRQMLPRAFATVPDWVFFAAYGAAFALALPWVAAQRRPFIYFQF